MLGLAMASAEQVKALIRSYSDGDDERFYSIAVQMAAQAARSGHAKLAQELRVLADAARAKPRNAKRDHAAPVPIATPRGDLAGLLSAKYPSGRLSEMSLAPPLRARLMRLLAEQRHRSEIRANGLSPMRKVLLCGPPGTGKTMSAAIIAGELGLPLFTLPSRQHAASIYLMNSMHSAQIEARQTRLARSAAS
jgi:ATPase family associated with various cellular activities (AAA)